MGKKVYILGGAGFLATPLTLELATRLDAEQISDLVIGGRTLAKAQSLVNQIGDRRVRAEGTDLTAENDVVNKVKGSNLLVNCLPAGFEATALRIACKAKVDYTDIGGAPPSDEEKNKVCKKAGIRAIPGIGIELVVILLAKKAASVFDSVDEINSNFCSFRTIAPSPGLLESIIFDIGPDCPIRSYYMGGRFVEAGPYEGSKQVKFPDPVGEQTVYHMTCVEITDWAQALPNAKLITHRGTWRPDIMRDMEGLIRLGLLDNAELNYKGQNINIADFVTKAIWRKVGGKIDRRYPWGYMYVVEVIGMKNGELKKVVYSIAHPDWQERSTANMVGISAAVNAILLLNKGRDKIGAPTKWDYYSLDDLEWLIKELATKGIIVKEEWT